MLQTLSIKNVALIKDIEIDFNKGFNVLLGETGAGKSIIFDALNFVLGAKADKTLIRSGESNMKVDAIFSDLSKQACHELFDLGIIDDEQNNELSISRSLDVDGKSICRVNGNLVTAVMLKSCGGLLVDSYSQHESIELLKSKNHLLMLDKLGGTTLKQLKDNLANEYDVYQNICRDIKALGGNEFERERTKSLLEYQIKEIKDANLSIGEDEEIKQRLNILSNSEKIVEIVSQCEQLLEESSMSAVNSVYEVSSLLAQLSDVEEIEGCRQRLNCCKIELQDISQTLKDLCSDTNFDEGELARLDARNDLIKFLCKKYGGSIERVLEFYKTAVDRFDELNNCEEKLQELETQRKAQEKKLDELSNQLSELRKKNAREIEVKMITELKQLGMKSTSFVIKFTTLLEFTSNGIDNVEFTFSANKGQEVKALAKTASGGEMSRVMLAFKTIFAEGGSAQTLIFDEIDTGISGETGYVVGEKLSLLANKAQVICITHLAQVASQGDSYYYVSKYDDGNATYTRVKTLTDDEITTELARVLSGDKITDVALAHIKEMRLRAGK